MRYLFVLTIALFMSCSLHAQVHINLNFNLGSQPAWGPTGNDYVEYYYLPDIEAYYSVSQHRFYYYEGNRWIGRAALPSRFHNFDLYNSYKVVVNEKDPWRNHKTYKEKYSSFKGRHDQEVIRNSRDSKYFINKNHPEHKKWIKQQSQIKASRNSSYQKSGSNGNVRLKGDKPGNGHEKQNNGKNKK